MALIPVTEFGQQFTTAEAIFLAAIADHSYTDGQLIIGNSSTGGISFNTLTAGTNVTITNGHGTITINASGGGGSGTVTSVASADGSITVTNPTTTVDLAVVKAPKWSTARNLAGNSVDGSANVTFANKFIVQGTTDTGLSAAQFLGALGTGIVKNTTTTGVLSIAVAADFPTLNQNTTGSAATLTTGRTIAITGDLTYTSSSFDGSTNITAAGTLATVNTNVGSFTNANITVNAKGLITAASNGTGGGGSPGGSDTQIQYNNAGAFGGLSTFTTDGTALTIANNTNLNFGGGSGNSTALKTGSDGTFLFDTGSGQNIKFKGYQATPTHWGFTDSSFNYVWNADATGNSTQNGTATLGANGGTNAQITFNGSTSGSTILKSAVAASGTLTLPAATDTLVGKATTDTLTNKTYDTAGTGNSFSINGTSITSVTGTGSVVLGTSPTITTSILAAASTANIGSTTTGWAHLYMASGGIIDFANGNLKLIHSTGILSSTSDFQVAAVGSNPASVPTLSSSSTLTNKTLTAPVINGTVTGTGQAVIATASTLMMRDGNANTSINNIVEGFTTTATAAGTTTMTVASTFTQVWTGSSTQTIKLPTTSVLQGQQYLIINQSTGLVTVQSSGANTIVILAASTSCLFTAVAATPTTAANWDFQYASVKAASGKVGTFSNTITAAGTDATTMTFPSTNATIARTDAAQTFTGTQTFSQIVMTNNAITATTNAATVPITSRLSTVTNNSAATLTITITTTSAVDGQMIIVRILDASAVAQTISWVNTENSTQSVPTTSNGSTTLPLTVGFMFNSATTKWRCIAVA